ncbi:MAG: beta-ketoacyl-[acyl-carrier-protein] synthase family protein [Acidobacteria bacterium]|nr:beta-ketoacyl-[acyl-carrier-protein] synthase family protein [Acidobacteriota bacterium]
MKRVVVTGIGVISPIGSGKAQFWEALLEGKSGIRPVASFDTSAFPVHIGAEVLDFQAERYLRRLAPASMGRASQLATAAARLALDDSGLDLAHADRRAVGTSIGTTSGEPQFVELYNDLRKAGNVEQAPAEIFPRYSCSSISVHVATEFDLRGPCLTIPTACAAGNHAIGQGFDLIRTGRVEAVLAGGADSFSRIPYMGFARLGAIAPQRCQPFDRNRKGMVPGEGAGMILLESLDRAVARGARIYAEVLGYGLSCDSHHMTASHPEGDGAIRAMQAALKDSGVGIEDIDYISAHGTGTPTNDRVESTAMCRLFGERARHVPMSSIKSMVGHTMGAASAIEAAACTLALDTGWIPPTINHEESDPDFDLDYVPNQSRQTRPQVVLNNAYAFGGNNASVCFRRYEGGVV